MLSFWKKLTLEAQKCNTNMLLYPLWFRERHFIPHIESAENNCTEKEKMTQLSASAIQHNMLQSV
jgi:hypothetical protein